MNKDEALKMAIDWMDKWHDKEVIVMNVGQRWVDFSMPIQACKEALETPVCNPHPLAPHGFNRNESHNAGRYVCDCEGWEFEWQGLTDDEMYEEILKASIPQYQEMDVTATNLKELIRAIEAKLKEKNHG